MLSVKNLTKVYSSKGGENVLALDNVSLDFPETGMVFLLGKSGSGKSTLLNLIGGLDEPTDGEIILKGRSSQDFDQSDFDSYRNTYIGFVFQEYNILNEFNVEQNIALALELQHKKATKEAIDNILTQVDLQSYAKRKPMTLSGGQKQRIAIARALIKEPKIILADEPTGSLDSKTGEQVFETLKKLSQDKLVIVVSHDREFAETYGDRIIELSDGRIITDETKYYREPTRISDNVIVMGDNNFRITDPKSLTLAEMQVVFDKLVETEGEVIIASGKNARKSMKASRMSADGKTEAFKNTESVPINQYNPADTKFIKSKMPIGKSIKMGLSSLKTKPIRLIFTILLAVISFTMFGVISSLMFYNPTYTYTKAVENSDYVAEKIIKVIDGIHTYNYYVGGELSSTSKYEDHKQAYFGVNELAWFNTNRDGLRFVGLVDIDYASVIQGFAITKNQEYYSAFDIKYLTDCDISGVTAMGYSIEGSYPNTDSQIALPMSYYYMIKDNVPNIDTPTDAIGNTIAINGKVYTITGFIRTEDIPAEYNKLKDGETITELEKTKLRNKFRDYLLNSFNHVGFVTTAGIKEYINLDKFAVYLNQYPRKGVMIAEYMPGTVGSENSFNVYTDEIYENNKTSFDLFTLDGVPMQDLELADDEILIGKSMIGPIYRDVAERLRTILYEFTNAPDNSHEIGNLMPTFSAYYATTSGRQKVDNLITALNEWNVTYADLREAEVIIANYKAEYVKAKKINNYIGYYCHTNAYSNIATSIQASFDRINNNNFTSEDIDTAYNYMLNGNSDPNIHDSFDEAVPYGVIAGAFNELYGWSDAQGMIQADDTLSSLYTNVTSQYGGYSEHAYLNEAQANLIKDFITTYVNNGGSYFIRFTGWTFSTMDYKTNINRNINTDYFYKNYLGNTGKLKVKGYYSLGSSSAILIKKSTIDSISNAADTYSETIFETKYRDTTDKKYEYLISRTEYTQNQIGMMTISRDGCSYRMTNSKYEAAAQVAETVVRLRQIFFWVGLSLGALAALMLLNFITVSISSKRKEIGVLRAIGARTSDVFKIFFAESLFIGMICCFLACIGTAVVDYLLNNSFMTQLGISVLSYGLINVGLILGISFLITLIATIIPVFHASKKPPVESIRAL